ncbi:hypothetical protein TNCV_2851081 [Trichonephila clavipes]|nr:hypothetical protein TNCV_2851081 [Trichonephila clavipes]
MYTHSITRYAKLRLLRHLQFSLNRKAHESDYQRKLKSEDDIEINENITSLSFLFSLRNMPVVEGVSKHAHSSPSLLHFFQEQFST